VLSLAPGRTGAELDGDSKIGTICAEILAPPLVEQGLIPGGAQKMQRGLLVAAVAGLGLTVAGARLWQAYVAGRRNVAFLVIEIAGCSSC
jgi:hypothetical protein